MAVHREQPGTSKYPGQTGVAGILAGPLNPPGEALANSKLRSSEEASTDAGETNDMFDKLDAEDSVQVIQQGCLFGAIDKDGEPILDEQNQPAMFDELKVIVSGQQPRLSQPKEQVYQGLNRKLAYKGMPMRPRGPGDKSVTDIVLANVEATLGLVPFLEYDNRRSRDPRTGQPVLERVVTGWKMCKSTGDPLYRVNIPEKLRFTGGEPVGPDPLVRQALVQTAVRFLRDKAAAMYVEGESHFVVETAVQLFLMRARQMEPDEDPMLMARAVVEHLVQFDPLERAYNGETIHKATNRDQTRHRRAQARVDAAAKQGKSLTLEEALAEAEQNYRVDTSAAPVVVGGDAEPVEVFIELDAGEADAEDGEQYLGETDFEHEDANLAQKMAERDQSADTVDGLAEDDIEEVLSQCQDKVSQHHIDQGSAYADPEFGDGDIDFDTL